MEEEQKISGVEPPKAIAETPPSTPVPQASSTAAHRPEESLNEVTVNVEEENCETRLSDIIGGLRFLGNTLQERESEISQRNPERAIARSESSSLGILKYDQMQSLSSDTLDEDIRNLIQRFEAKLASNIPAEDLFGDSPADRTLVSENEADTSDLSIDLRVRLQKELAQRTMERFSLPETPKSQHNYSPIANRSFQEGRAVSGETFTINKWPTKLSLNSEQDIVKTEKDANDPYSFMNEAIRTSSFMSSDRMVQLADFSNESFIPGEQCEQLLVRDEAAWTEENIPPVADTSINRSTSQLEFSGVVGNAEISLPNVSTYIGNLNSKLSIGEYFRLKSEDPASLTDRCSYIFTKKQQNLKDDKDRESVNTTLSLSQIAGILRNLDSAMSPRTLVAGFLKHATSTKSASSSMYETPASDNTPKIVLQDDSHNDRTVYDPDGSQESDNTGWMFEVPKTSEGLGSRAYSLVLNDPQKENVAAAQKTITIEDSIAAGDLSMVKLDKTANESVVCLTKELASKPKESVDCSALLPTLRKYCPGIRSDKQDAEFIDATAFAGPICKNSISMLCSEDKEKQTPWASAVSPYPSPTICVGVPCEIVIPIENLTAHWLICGLELVHVQLPGGVPDNDNLAIVKLPPKTVLMDPNNTKEAKIEVVPVCEGQMEMALQINLEDVVTKATQRLFLNFTFFGEEPALTARCYRDDKAVDVTMNDDGEPVINFGVMPEECVDYVLLSLYNKGEATVPLQITTDTKSPSGFGLFFMVPEEVLEVDNFEEALIKNRKMYLQIELAPETECKFLIICATPPMNLFTEKEGFCEMSGCMTVTLMSVKPLDLQEIQLCGIIGTTKFALQVASQPLKLVSKGMGRTDRHYLPLKNWGRVPFSLIFHISENDRILRKDDFTVRPSELKLEPGETSRVLITFTPSSSQQVPVFRTLYIRMLPLGPQYFVELVGTIVKPNAERKAISPVQLHNKIKSLNISLNTASEKIRESKLTAKKSPKEKEKIISGSPLLSRSHISQSTRRSSSSNSDTAQCEKLHIQSTRRELVWGSVEVGNSVMKTCTIRSLAEHRCRMQISINDKNNVYKLMNEKGELVTQRKTMLHSNENLVLNVMFNPSKTGPLPAKLTFTHLHSEDTSNVHIPLYGCGGHARLVVKGIPRDGAGRMWLTLQQQDSEQELFWESTFSVRNLGDLPAFLKVRVASKGFHHVNEGSFVVEPSELVITKGSIENIKVFCRPRPQDLKLLLSGHVQDVIEVATVNLISGGEPTRHRLRRLHKLMMKQNAEQKDKFTEIDLAAITAPFPGERGIPKLDSLKDTLESIHELYHSISLQEVIVLLENNSDRTIQEGDTSRVFHSLHEVDISRTRIEDTTSYHIEEETLFTDIAKSPTKCTWNIVPTSLIITLPVNICAIFRLKTDSNRNQPFETCVPAHPPGWVLSLNPSTGFIPASDELIVVVSCSPSNESSPNRPLLWKGIIQVFIENDLKEVNITVIHNQRSKQDPRPVSQPKNKSPNKTSNRIVATPASASQTGTIRRSQLLQKPSVQPQKRSPTKLSKIPVPSVTLAPIIGGYFVSDWNEELEQQNYKAHLERPNASFMQPSSKTAKKSPNSKR